eukprot:TRINITY_DN29437_c0_g1_i1.p1 TRINITY_DN29437_c0_g1~~TRINITY_DN29437_c0_g1_i1.p1  ORF type:complete len:258 (+),score=24.63 TRINITY_DN29437_c0_g1_i1:60-776(+)
MAWCVDVVNLVVLQGVLRDREVLGFRATCTSLCKAVDQVADVRITAAKPWGILKPAAAFGTAVYWLDVGLPWVGIVLFTRAAAKTWNQVGLLRGFVGPFILNMCCGSLVLYPKPPKTEKKRNEIPNCYWPLRFAEFVTGLPLPTECCGVVLLFTESTITALCYWILFGMDIVLQMLLYLTLLSFFGVTQNYLRLSAWAKVNKVGNVAGFLGRKAGTPVERHDPHQFWWQYLEQRLKGN